MEAIKFDAVRNSVNEAKEVCVAYIKQYIDDEHVNIKIQSEIDGILVSYSVIGITENGVKMKDEDGSIFEEEYSLLNIAELSHIAYCLAFGW